MTNEDLDKLARLVRSYIIRMTTEAQSGHMTSSLSAVDLMVTLLFGGFFRAKLDEPEYHNNDRLIFSKGHASPLLYALYAAMGKLSVSDLMKLRTFESPLEGHPSMRWPYTEAATGSLGQGLSIGVGMALAARLDKLNYGTFVLLGDSEMAEGSVWEAMEIAAHYKLNNLIAIMDVNRLGQSGETMFGHDLESYQRKVEAFGWKAVLVDGHNLEAIRGAYEQGFTGEQPVMIIAKTVKGKGIPDWENKNGKHAKTLSTEEMEKILEQLGSIDDHIQGTLPEPKELPAIELHKPDYTERLEYKIGEEIATKEAFGNALKTLSEYSEVVVLDAEVSNSTRTELFKEEKPERFFEMYVAEQNMIGTAVGLSARGKLPFVSSFGAFLTRAHDQIRMAQYSDTRMVIASSYAGVSLGKDGTSQMALEDIAMFRSLRESVVLYPCDATSTDALTHVASEQKGIVALRLTRGPTPVLYQLGEHFEVGGSKTVKSSDRDRVTIVSAGITLFEALKAYESLYQEGVIIRVIDLYSVKPVDVEALKKAASETEAIIVVEDHYPAGGMGEAVRSALGDAGVAAHVYQMAVDKMPRSGEPEELLAYMEIDADAIQRKVKTMLGLEVTAPEEKHTSVPDPVKESLSDADDEAGVEEESNQELQEGVVDQEDTDDMGDMEELFSDNGEEQEENQEPEKKEVTHEQQVAAAEDNSTNEGTDEKSEVDDRWGPPKKEE